VTPAVLKLYLGLGSGALAVGLGAGFLARVLVDRFPRISFRMPALPALKTDKRLDSSQTALAGGLFISILVMAFGDFRTGFPLAMAAILGWYGIQKGPAVMKNYGLRKRLEKMNEVFPQTLGMAVQALKTGQTVPQVLEYLSHECPPPLKEELVQVCMEMDLGISTEMALSKMAERFPDFIEFHQFLESYKISRQTGANLTHLLEVLLEGLEEKNRLLRKMEAMTAQARLSGIMMGLLPFLLSFVFFLMDPDLMTPLFTQKMGWAILLLALVLEGIGFAWIRHLLQLEA
jgi:Flp pilus assembly protein TadB